MIKHKLKSATVGIDVDAAVDPHLHPVLGIEGKQLRVWTKHHRTELPLGIFQVEVEVPGTGAVERPDLALHPHIAEPLVEHLPETRDEF